MVDDTVGIATEDSGTDGTAVVHIESNPLALILVEASEGRDISNSALEVTSLANLGEHPRFGNTWGLGLERPKGVRVDQTRSSFVDFVETSSGDNVFHVTIVDLAVRADRLDDIDEERFKLIAEGGERSNGLGGGLGDSLLIGSHQGMNDPVNDIAPAVIVITGDHAERLLGEEIGTDLELAGVSLSTGRIKTNVVLLGGKDVA